MGGYQHHPQRVNFMPQGPPTDHKPGTGLLGAGHRLSPALAAAAEATALLLFGFPGAEMLTTSSTGDSDRALAGTPAAVAGMGQRKPECTARYALGRAVNGRFSNTLSIANITAVPIADARLCRRRNLEPTIGPIGR